MNALLLLASAFTLWWVDPYGQAPYLPSAEPYQGCHTNVLSLAAAKDEIETVSFSVEPQRDMKKVDFVPSDLTGPGGAKIPASAADFSLVKVWYRAGGRWSTSFPGSPGKPELINDLVLHDDDLVRVDEKEKTIYLRIDYPDGPDYVDMKKRGAAHFSPCKYPVRDAKAFVPFDLKKGRFQQYWLTWHVPKDAKPGLYRGKLEVKEAGAPHASIPVELEVYPFELPDARAHYDTSKPFVCSWMGTPSLGGALSGFKNYEQAERFARACHRSLAEHNIHDGGPGAFSVDDTDNMTIRDMIIQMQEGRTPRLVYAGGATVGSWADPHDSGFVSPEENPELYARVMKTMRDSAETQAKFLDKYYGHRNALFCGVDECGSWVHRRSFGFYAALHEYGFDIWSDSGNAFDMGWCIGVNDIAASARVSDAWNWHKAGSCAQTYAGCFAGPANPQIWRRTKGLRYYFADFDGMYEYLFYYGAYNHWNDFRTYGMYCQFQIAYLAYDGIIRTLAYEALREGQDDVRYMSLLKLRAEAAMKSADPKVRAVGKRHYVWLESQDPEEILDLFAFRREVARRAAELVKLVGEEPTTFRLLRPIPELPPMRYGKSVPADADLVKLADEYVKRNRYDLAMPLLAKIMRDTGRPVGVRLTAACDLASLQSQQLQRDEAVKTMDEALSWSGIPKAQRGKMQLQKVSIMMTDSHYAEVYTKKQLEEIGAAVIESTKAVGAAPQANLDLVLKVAGAYDRLGLWQEKLAWCEARLADTPLPPHGKSAILVVEAFIWVDQGDKAKAAELFRRARNAPGGGRHREALRMEGLIAEEMKNYQLALDCWQKEVGMYDMETEQNKKGWCQTRINRISGKLRKSEASKTLDADSVMSGEVDIKLDED